MEGKADFWSDAIGQEEENKFQCIPPFQLRYVFFHGVNIHSLNIHMQGWYTGV